GAAAGRWEAGRPWPKNDSRFPDFLSGDVCYPRRRIGMSRLVLLTDRSPEQALPASLALGLDVKVEPLSVDALARLPDLEPEAVLVDGAQDPATAHSILEVLAGTGSGVPLVVVVQPHDLERFPWEEVADDLLYPTAGGAEISVRLAMLRRRIGSPPEGDIRLGRLTLSTDTYQVTVDGR